MSTAPIASEKIVDEVRQRLIESGDWDRISAQLRSQLEESGWLDDIHDLAKETARNQPNPNLEKLVQEITPQAKNSIQTGVRDNVLGEIEKVLDRIVERA